MDVTCPFPGRGTCLWNFFASNHGPFQDGINWSQLVHESKVTWTRMERRQKQILKKTLALLQAVKPIENNNYISEGT